MKNILILGLGVFALVSCRKKLDTIVDITVKNEDLEGSEIIKVEQEEVSTKLVFVN